MRRMILLLAVMISFFISEGISSGVTLEQALSEIDKYESEGSLKPKEYVMAVSAMERLTAIGVSVDSAYQLVIASMDYNIRAKRLAPIVYAFESGVPTTGTILVDVATVAIKNNYGYKDVLHLIGTVNIGGKAGAGNDISAEIVLMAVERGLDSDDIRYIVENFVEDVKNGLSPEEAKGKALKDIENSK